MTPATARHPAFRALGSRPPTAIALAAAVAAIVLDWYWPWGLLFVYWTVPNIQRGEAFLIEPIPRARNPVLILGDYRNVGRLRCLDPVRGSGVASVVARMRRRVPRRAFVRRRRRRWRAP